MGLINCNALIGNVKLTKVDCTCNLSACSPSASALLCAWIFCLFFLFTGRCFLDLKWNLLHIAAANIYSHFSPYSVVCTNRQGFTSKFVSTTPSFHHTLKCSCHIGRVYYFYYGKQYCFTKVTFVWWFFFYYYYSAWQQQTKQIVNCLHFFFFFSFSHCGDGC